MANKKQKEILEDLKKINLNLKPTNKENIFKIDLNEINDSDFKEIIINFIIEQNEINNKQEIINKDFLEFLKDAFGLIRDQMNWIKQFEKNINKPITKWN